MEKTQISQIQFYFCYTNFIRQVKPIEIMECMFIYHYYLFIVKFYNVNELHNYSTYFVFCDYSSMIDRK